MTRLFTLPSLAEGIQFGIVLLLLVGLGGLYLRGWLQMRHRMAWFATYARLVYMAIALGLVGVIFTPFLNWGASQLMTVRALQQVMISLIIPPLFWLACPVTVIRSGVLGKIGHSRTKAPSPKHSGLMLRLCRWILSPGVGWLIFMSTFLLWHEAALVNWGFSGLGSQYLLLSMLLFGSLLLWMHVIGSGPRLSRPLPGWARFLLLIGAEIPNMIAGVTTAFSTALLYEAYGPLTDAFLLLPLDNRVADQRMSGIVVWILGSAIYLSTGFGVLNHWFKRNELAVPMLSFEEEATDRTIAPGLEHRVRQIRWHKALGDT